MNGKQLDSCAVCEPQLVSKATGMDGERASADPAKAGYRNTPNPLKMLLEHGTPRGKMPGGVPTGFAPGGLWKMDRPRTRLHLCPILRCWGVT